MFFYDSFKTLSYKVDLEQALGEEWEHQTWQKELSQTQTEARFADQPR